MTSKTGNASGKQEGADKFPELGARAPEASWAAGDGRCPECGGWRCNGVCQFGGT